MPEKWIEIARTGVFTDSAGRPQTFTDADLAAIASAYDPEKRDCPLVFGHPQSDSAPAFGWASKVKAEKGKLFARFAQVPKEVSELVAKGHYRHVSMSLMPDRKTLRHVALLGAAQPAIDCLKAVELRSSGEDCISIDFANEDYGGHMPDDSQREIGALKERLAALEKENAQLKQKAEGHKTESEKAAAEKKEAQEKEAKTAADFAAYREKVEGEKREARISALVAAGKLKPAEKAGVLQFAAALAKQTDAIEFAAADGSTTKLTLEEKYIRELEARQPDGRAMEFSAMPTHAADKQQNINPDELTAKL